MYVYIYNINSYAYIHTLVYPLPHTQTHTHIHMHARAHTHKRICMYVYVCVCMPFLCARFLHVHTYRYTARQSFRQTRREGEGRRTEQKRATEGTRPAEERRSLAVPQAERRAAPEPSLRAVSRGVMTPSRVIAFWPRPVIESTSLPLAHRHYLAALDLEETLGEG